MPQSFSSVFLLALCSLALINIQVFVRADALSPPFHHVILFSWDGAQYNHLIELFTGGSLANLEQLVNETRLPILRALITDHLTETNNAHPSILSGVGHGEVDGCPDNTTVWENIEALNNAWVTGAVAGKAKFTDTIFPHAHSDVDFWHAADESASEVTDRAVSFIHNYSKNSFFLFIHYREPDLAGHTHGENSLNYDNAVIRCDAELGRVLSTLEVEGIADSTAIVVTTDHGFRENGYGHTSPAWGADNGDPDVYTTWIACNTGTVDQTNAANNYWDQNDVAPTIYSIIGIDDYSVRWQYIRGSALWHRSFKTRDIAMVDLQPSSNLTTGGTLTFNVTIQNLGDFTEIPTIALFHEGTVIGKKTLVYPDPPLSNHDRGDSLQTVSFIWNATGVPQGTHTIFANASIIPGGGTNHPSLAYTKNETDTVDNNCVNTTVRVIPNNDIALLDISVYPDETYVGGILNITVAAANLGSITESFNATAGHNNTAISTKTMQLAPGEKMILVYSWNTIGLSPGQTWTIWANTSTTDYDVNVTNNQVVMSRPLYIKMLGDINGDDKVNMEDVEIVLRAFGASSGHRRYDLDADVNSDGMVNLNDVVVVLMSFGKSLL